MRYYNTTNRDKKREKTEYSILEESIVHFGKLGYAHTIMRDIAKDAGVAYGLINKYYGTKERLLIEAYRYALTKVYIKEREMESVYDILTDLIKRTRIMQKELPDYFLFFKTSMNASDLPEAFTEERKNLFLNADYCKLYYAAQERGELPAGDVFGLFQMFLVTLYNLLDMNSKYGLPEPKDQVFFDAIHYIDPVTKRIREFQQKTSKAIGDTLAGLAVVDINKNTGTQVRTSNAIVTLTDSTDIRASINEAIDVHISESDRQKMKSFLNVDTLAERLKEKKVLTMYCMQIQGRTLNTIIPYSYDENGRVAEVLMGIQIVEQADHLSGTGEEYESFRE